MSVPAVAMAVTESSPTKRDGAFAEAARPGTVKPDMTELPSIWIISDNHPLSSSRHPHRRRVNQK